jgi:streptogramin lyase
LFALVRSGAGGVCEPPRRWTDCFDPEDLMSRGWWVTMLVGVCGVWPASAGAVAITEFSDGLTPNATPTSIVAGPDGNLWFTEFRAGRIGRITPAGTITEFSTGITANAGPADIVAGPDGNLWFTEELASRIGRITPAGAVTEFPDGGSSLPIGITAGADGNLWVAQGTGGVARVTPAGAITQFATPGEGLDDITSGPDGNLWFNNQAGPGVIGRITPAGTITEFAQSGSDGELTAGPDGDVWFTQSASNAIGRITPAGAISEFSAGLTANAGPAGITTGPDGNLWFTESGVDQIGRIAPDGTITELPVGTAPAADLLGITTGPDGNLWFTEASANRIGRVSLSGAPTAEERTLSVTAAGTGTGTVSSRPAGIDCGRSCSYAYAAGTPVTLTATPSAGSTFAGFAGGGCAGAQTTCTVTLTADTAVTATFAAAAAAAAPPAGATTPAPPPAGATPVTTTAKPSSPKVTIAGLISGLPSTRSCRSRRSFTIHLRTPSGTRIAKATVKVDGRPVATRTGKRVTAPITLKGLPKGRYKVSIALTLTNGRTLSETRGYRTCAARKHA